VKQTIQKIIQIIQIKNVTQIHKHSLVQLNQQLEQTGIQYQITNKHGVEQHGYQQTQRLLTIQHQVKQNVDTQTHQIIIQKMEELHSYQTQQHELVHDYQTIQQQQHLVIIQERGQRHGITQKQHHIQKMEHYADLHVMYDITIQTKQIHVMKEH
jgi:hypothetical protein